MTLTQIQMRIWNPEAYEAADVREAAIQALATLTAPRETIDQAVLLLSGSGPLKRTFERSTI